MAPKARRSQRTTRSGDRHTDLVPDVYKDMLAEVDVPSKIEHENGSHAVKRRRVGARGAASKPTNIQDSDLGSITSETELISRRSETSAHNQSHVPPLSSQTTYASSSNESEFEDVDWEEVAFEEEGDSDQKEDTLDLTLKSTGKSDPPILERKRKPITAAERVIRINVHKMHLLCLIAHLRIRNSWCNDGQVQVSRIFRS
jgi:xeroderma pigmentosum group C-complementing protein